MSEKHWLVGLLLIALLFSSIQLSSCQPTTSLGFFMGEPPNDDEDNMNPDPEPYPTNPWVPSAIFAIVIIVLAVVAVYIYKRRKRKGRLVEFTTTIWRLKGLKKGFRIKTLSKVACCIVILVGFVLLWFAVYYQQRVAKNNELISKMEGRSFPAYRFIVSFNASMVTTIPLLATIGIILCVVGGFLLFLPGKMILNEMQKIE